MNKENFKIVLVGTILILAINPLIMLIHTTIEFFSEIKFDTPLTAYLICGYFPLFVAGIYIASAKTTSRIQICILVSMFYVLKRAFFDNLFDADPRHDFLQYKIIILINLTVLSSLIVIGSCAIADRIRKRIV